MWPGGWYRNLPVTVDRHLRFSLALCAVFLAAGLWLEAMFGLRAGGWVDDPIRREFLRLGHAHGGVLALLNLGLSWSMHRLRTPERWARAARVAAWAGALAVGAGFMAGGLWHGATDPGPPVLVVPAGALSILAALVVVVLVRPTGGSGSASDDSKIAGRQRVVAKMDRQAQPSGRCPGLEWR